MLQTQYKGVHVLKGYYLRNQIDLCPQKPLTINDINAENMISLRMAVICQSASGGQDCVQRYCSLM